MLTLAAAAEPTPGLTENIWVVVGVPVLVALIGAAAAVGVALAASRTQTRIAAEQRAEAALQAERAVRESVMEGIIKELSALAQRYGSVVAMLEHIGSDPGTTFTHPSRAKLMRALSRLTTHLGRRDLFVEVADWLVAFSLNFPVSRGQTVIGLLQRRLDDWYLGETSLEEAIARLARDTDYFMRQKMPPFSA